MSVFKRSTAGWLLFSLLGAWSLLLAQDIEVWVGPKKYEIDVRRRDGQLYYELKDIAEALGLRLQDRGGLVTVQGPRGNLELTAERPLIRFEQEYILLSGPVWRRRAQDWYVSEDFLAKALPLVVSRRLEKISDGRYQLEALAQNQVRVRFASYPDHVRIVFQSEHPGPVQVAEYDKYIEVEFSEYLVNPEFPSTDPDQRFVSSLEFNTDNIYGAFRIYKGQHFYNFREFTLADPPRKVVDVYGPPALTALPREGEPPDSPVPGPEPGSSAPSSAPSPDLTLPRVPENVITIDPGHGGEDQGASSPAGLLEKNLTLEMAAQIGSHVQSGGYHGMLTRTRDVELAPEQRSAAGNYNRSRVYLSIHVGGAPSSESRGPVVYVHKYIGANAAAAKQPRASSPSSVRQLWEGAGGVEDSLELVPWEGAQKQYLGASRQLAERIQNPLNLLWGTNNQVVEVPLAVLAPVAAPAILIETGFLSNPQDHERLSSPEFRRQIARVIGSAVTGFLQSQPGQSTNGDAGGGQP